MLVTASKARVTVAIAMGLLTSGGLAAPAAWADAPDGGMETTHGPSLVTIDNSNADSWLEVDRTANVLAPFSHGTAGSDHDGGGGAIEQRVTGSPGTGLQAAPDEDGTEDEEDDEAAGAAEGAGAAENGEGAGGTGGAAHESAATGGDDDEGDADHDAPPTT